MVFVERPSAMMVGSWELNKLHQKNGRANHENCETGGFNHHTWGSNITNNMVLSEHYRTWF